MLPATTIVAPNSPSARVNPSSAPARILRDASGSVTVVNTRHGRARRVWRHDCRRWQHSGAHADAGGRNLHLHRNRAGCARGVTACCFRDARFWCRAHRQSTGARRLMADAATRMPPQFELRFLMTQGAFTVAADLEIAARAIALFGPSGSGKTTILEVIAGLRSPKHGR